MRADGVQIGNCHGAFDVGLYTKYIGNPCVSDCNFPGYKYSGWFDEDYLGYMTESVVHCDLEHMVSPKNGRRVCRMNLCLPATPPKQQRRRSHQRR